MYIERKGTSLQNSMTRQKKRLQLNKEEVEINYRCKEKNLLLYTKLQ